MLLLWIGRAQADEVPRGQLPADVTPTHYALELTVIPDQDGFSGLVTIDATVAKPIDHIWLHGQDLNVTRATVTDAHGETLTATWSEIKDTGGVVRLGLPRPLALGPITIAIAYTASFNRQLEGLYRSDEGGESYVFSQMEPIAARRAFPGFDEPRFKTPFDITVTLPERDVAVSNAPTLHEEQRGSGLKRVQFATTKPLPTYLIALAVGPFDVVTWKPIAKSPLRDHEIPLRGIAVKGKGRQLHYALANTEGLLSTLEDYFGIPYPYEKLDIIAALDFSAGAMENAGAIVYREQLLLFDDDAAITQKRRYVITHAHEMSHQWFGDLVTPAWWNDTWLNEAFATWMEVRAAATWDPKGDYSLMSVVGGIGAMGLDSWHSARRIAEPVRTNDDIANAFDGITYDKGGAVLAMFEHYYGAETFRKGVQLYLRQHAWGTATTDDFLNALAEASGDPAGVAAFRSFLDQSGVPVVRASLACSRDPAVNIRQTRYLQSPRLASMMRFQFQFNARPLADQIWKIPLCVAYGNGDARGEVCKLITDRNATEPLPKPCPGWIMPNAGAAAYARFTLERKDWDALIGARNALSDAEVLSVLDSLDGGFTAQSIHLDDYLTRLRALLTRDRGRDALPVAPEVASMALPRLIWIKDVLAPDALRPAAEKLIRDIYAPWAEKLGLRSKPATDAAQPVEAALLRPVAVSAAAVQGHAPKLRAALLDQGLSYLSEVEGGRSPDDLGDLSLVDAALTVAVQDGGAPVVKRIIALLQTERDATLRQRMLNALTRSQDPVLAENVRALALDDRLRVNEVPILVYGAVRERENAAAGWTWFKQNFDTIAQRTPPGDRGDLTEIGGAFCTAAAREDYRTFFRPRVKALTGGLRQFAATLEQIDSCIALTDAQRPRLAKALAALSSP